MILWLAAAAALVLAAGAGWTVNWVLQRRRLYSHEGLFGGLCRLHKLDRGSRTLLRQVAGAHNLRHPARLFLEPQWLDADRLPPLLRLRAAEMASLRQRLFGGPEPPAG